MPNWCSNNLYLECTPKEFKAFCKQYLTPSADDPDELEFNFELFDPTPQEMLDAGSPCKPDERDLFRKKYGYEDWYAWRIAHWGTKWTPVITDIEGNRIRFDSAWSPPGAAIQTLAKLCPHIKFRLEYLEEDNAFGGILEVQGDEVIEDESYGSDDPGYQKMRTIFGVDWEDGDEDEKDEDA